jgi:putative nucleotidyltransferase with HDIG domain
MLGWLKRLFGGGKQRRSRNTRKGKARSGGSSSASAPEAQEEKPPLKNKPAVGNLDAAPYRALPVAERDRALLERLSAQVESGKFELPHLPATSLALVNLAGKPGVDVERVVQLISSDPSLASELLRTANSVLYATRVPASTLNEAVMRIGLRGLRSLIFTVSVKGTILRLGQLQEFSTEIWRQAFSVATIARTIAPLLGEDREVAFLTGLLHDIGKIALLSILSKEPDAVHAASPAIVGHLFYVHHERAGEMMAKSWRLSDELISVTGCHHDFESNEEFGRSAALASLAHKLDLHLSLGDDGSYRELVHCEELEFLGVPEGRRGALLGRARDTYEEAEYEQIAA